LLRHRKSYSHSGDVVKIPIKKNRNSMKKMPGASQRTLSMGLRPSEIVICIMEISSLLIFMF